VLRAIMLGESGFTISKVKKYKLQAKAVSKVSFPSQGTDVTHVSRDSICHGLHPKLHSSLGKKV